MDSEWARISLDELYEFSSGLSKPRSDFGSGYPFLSFKDVFYNSAVPQLTELVNSTEQERLRCSVNRGDVFLTRTSETMDELGMSSVALADFPNATFNGFTKRLRPKHERRVLPEFARYYFRSPEFRKSVTVMSSMSTRASLNNEMLARLAIVLPPLGEQCAIAQTLGALDDRFANLRESNNTLHAIASALFRSWLVTFDGVPHENMRQSELGLIPKGWCVATVGDLATVSSGKRPESRFPHPTEEASVELWGGNGPIAFTTRPLINERILLTGRVGTLGSVFRISKPCWPSDNTLFLSERRRFVLNYLFFQLRQMDFASLNRGSTQPLLTQTDLKSQSVVLPPEEVLSRFDEIAEPLFQKIEHNLAQADTLAALRDALLPRLISGQLRVRP